MSSTSDVALYCHDCIAILVRRVSIHMKVRLALVTRGLKEDFLPLDICEVLGFRRDTVEVSVLFDVAVASLTGARRFEMCWWPSFEGSNVE